MCIILIFELIAITGWNLASFEEIFDVWKVEGEKNINDCKGILCQRYLLLTKCSCPFHMSQPPYIHQAGCWASFDQWAMSKRMCIKSQSKHLKPMQKTIKNNPSACSSLTVTIIKPTTFWDGSITKWVPEQLCGVDSRTITSDLHWTKMFYQTTDIWGLIHHFTSL